MKTIHPENHWYIVDNKGFINKATEDNKVDAMLIAKICDTDYPHDAPHKAIQLVDAEIARDLLDALRRELDGAEVKDDLVHAYLHAMTVIKKAEGVGV